MVGTTDSGKVVKLVDSVNEFVQSEVHSEWAVITIDRVQETEDIGEVAARRQLVERVDESLVTSQYRSLVMAVLIVLLLVAVQFRSLLAGIIGVVPILFTGLLNFGLMGYLGIPLDVTTVMIASVAVGIGVDYAIHFLSRVRLERTKGGDIEGSLRATLETTGIAISINAVSVSAGSIAILFGSPVPMRNFGWMTALTMIVSALSAMVLIPSILISIKAITVNPDPRLRSVARSRGWRILHYRKTAGGDGVFESKS